MNPIISRPAFISKQSVTSNPSLVGAIPNKSSSTTVFVGNISDKVPDVIIRQLLGKCGTIITWKRLTGVNNKPQAFGFCEYENPESTLRCIRLLNGWMIGDKALLVKVDEKTRNFLDEYLESKNANQLAGGSGTTNKEGENDGNPNQVNGDQNAVDETVRQALQAILEEFTKDLLRQMEFQIEMNKEQRGLRKDRLEGPKHLTIEDMGLDNEKKDLITREIEVFRKLHQDEDVDRDQRERELRMRFQMQQMRGHRRLEDVSQSPARHVHGSDSSKKHPSRSRSPGHSKTQGNRLHKSSKVKAPRTGGSDDENSNVDKLRMEKKIMLKESAYNHRLQNWVKREQNQARIYNKEVQRLAEKKRDAEVEAQRLLAFFQRYDDTKDDSKYYKGSNLTRRLRDRSVEERADEEDRLMELEELEELRLKLIAEENPEVANIILHTEQAMNRHLQKKLNLLDLEELPVLGNEHSSEARHSSDSDRSSHSPNNAWKESPRYAQKKPIPSTSPTQGNTESPTRNLSGAKGSIKPIDSSSNSSTNQGKNRVELTSAKSEPNPSSIGVKETQSRDQSFSILLEAARKGDSNAKTEVVKIIIQGIPTEKEALFDYPIKWEAVNLSFVNERIRPWVDKKINAYVGEDVPSLSEFICEQVLHRKSPRNILQDVSMVLDDEAEVFVVKMWRLLIYVLQAKEAGIDS